MSNPLRFSRWRRLPGWHRITEKKLPTHRTEFLRLTLYMQGSLLDQAERLAMRSGETKLQSYCEQLLGNAIEAELARQRVQSARTTESAAENLGELLTDPVARAHWAPVDADFVECDAPQSDPASPATDANSTRRQAGPLVPASQAAQGADVMESGSGAVLFKESNYVQATQCVLRHAAHDPVGSSEGYITTLRGGGPLVPAGAEELIQAISDLSQHCRDAHVLDRALVYALFQIAIESEASLSRGVTLVERDAESRALVARVRDAITLLLAGASRGISGRVRGSESNP